MRGSKSDGGSGVSSDPIDAVNIILQVVMMSKRQISKWVDRAINSRFWTLACCPQCSIQLFHLLESCIVLINLQLHAIGLSHKRTLYASQYADSHSRTALLQHKHQPVSLSYIRYRSGCFYCFPGSFLSMN